MHTLAKYLLELSTSPHLAIFGLIVLAASVIGALSVIWNACQKASGRVKVWTTERRRRRKEDFEREEIVKAIGDEFKPNSDGVSKFRKTLDSLQENVCVVSQRQLAVHNLDSVGIWETDSVGLCRYVNPAMAVLAGYGVEVFTGLGWKNTVHPDDVDDLNEGWSSAVEDKRDFSFQYRFLRPDGSIVPVKITGKRMFGPKGEVIGWIGDCRPTVGTHNTGPGLA